MDATVDVGDGDLDVVICVDEFGPLNLQPHPRRQWALAGGGGPTPRRRATYRRPHGVRYLFAADDLSRDKLYGHIRRRKRRGEFLSFLRYLRRLYPLTIRIAIVLDNYSPHLSTTDDPRVGRWAAANNVELAYVNDGRKLTPWRRLGVSIHAPPTAYTPTNASHLQRFAASRWAVRCRIQPITNSSHLRTRCLAADPSPAIPATLIKAKVQPLSGSRR